VSREGTVAAAIAESSSLIVPDHRRHGPPACGDNRLATASLSIHRRWRFSPVCPSYAVRPLGPTDRVESPPAPGQSPYIRGPVSNRTMGSTRSTPDRRSRVARGCPPVSMVSSIKFRSLRRRVVGNAIQIAQQKPIPRSPEVRQRQSRLAPQRGRNEMIDSSPSGRAYDGSTIARDRSTQCVRPPLANRGYIVNADPHEPFAARAHWFDVPRLGSQGSASGIEHLEQHRCRCALTAASLASKHQDRMRNIYDECRNSQRVLTPGVVAGVHKLSEGVEVAAACRYGQWPGKCRASENRTGDLSTTHQPSDVMITRPTVRRP